MFCWWWFTCLAVWLLWCVCFDSLDLVDCVFGLVVLLCLVVCRFDLVVLCLFS